MKQRYVKSFRNHMSDTSFMREWSMHRMLRRFGLPYLRITHGEVCV